MNSTETKNLTPVRLEGTREEDVLALKKLLHEQIDRMFEHVEYDAHGDAVNVIRCSTSTEVFCPPVVADVIAPLPVGEKLEISVSSTYNQVKKKIEALETKKLVDAERDSEGFVVMSSNTPGSL